MHCREHVGAFTLLSQASGFQTFFPHAAHSTNRPLRCSNGLRERDPFGMHASEQYRFRTACALVWHGKIAEQVWQTFQNGYTRLLLPCNFFCNLEDVLSASFNDAAMAS